ncbi:MAG: hypothetical protein MK179_19610 [Pirellulaceae bacterium]|nr:hypothetical protein [Pirellulaceae bacterium]
MPIHLPAISHRQFTSGAAGVIGSGVLVPKGYPRNVDSDLNRFALVSDTHIMPDPAATARGINMTEITFGKWWARLRDSTLNRRM